MVPVPLRTQGTLSASDIMGAAGKAGARVSSSASVYDIELSLYLSSKGGGGLDRLVRHACKRQMGRRGQLAGEGH